MHRSRALLCGFLFLLAGARAFGEGSEILFRADSYTRDFQKNTINAKGNAWLKKDGREVWADEFEFDYNTRRALATGNVHIKDGGMEIWCRRADYNMAGEDATLDDATVALSQLVMSGSIIRKVDNDHFEVEEGSYTNCNVELKKDPTVGECTYDWKIYGHKFSLTREGYALVSDAVVFIRNLPVFYSPYFVAPVKTKRQTGFFMPHVGNVQNLGNAYGMPFFWDMGPWQDLTIDPTYYSAIGYHLGLNYRYIYSTDTNGFFNFSAVERRFPSDLTAATPTDRIRPKLLGVVGEWGLYAKNRIQLGERAHSRQTFRLVSDPRYTFNFGPDVGLLYDTASLRSLVSLTYPTDDLLMAGQIQHHQSMIVTTDQGMDRGGVSQLPKLSFGKISSPIWQRYLSYEIDADFSNFYRPNAFDPLPFGGRAIDVFDPRFDYLRTGQRFIVEPRLVANVPMPDGFQLQPVLKAGSLIYHFDLPRSEMIHREYLQAEIPLSLFFHRTFETSIRGYEKISHVFQPRLIYATTPYQSGPVDHPFFTVPTAPRFDLVDQFINYEYARVELINRLRRKTGPSDDRFFLFQLANQYNFKTSAADPRYTRRSGPLEVLMATRIWRFDAQVQAEYQLETTLAPTGARVRENTWSSTLSYRGDEKDNVSLTGIFRNSINPALVQQSLYFNFYKQLPTFFDITGGAEYSFKLGELLGYSAGFHFGSKPRQCWGISLTQGRNSLKQTFVFVNFHLNLGTSSGNF